MATITMYMEWPGVTDEQYQAVLDELNLDENPPEGGLLHIATLTPDGLSVVDVWESREAFDIFSNERMMPAVKTAGIESEPRIEIRPTHNIYAPGLDVIAQLGASSMPDDDEEDDSEDSEESEDQVSVPGDVERV